MAGSCSADRGWVQLTSSAIITATMATPSLERAIGLPAATLLLKVGTREEAIGWAERYGKILGDCELELGKVNEPWDIGLMPPPENPPLQILLIEKAETDK